MSKIAHFFESAFSHDTKIETNFSIGFIPSEPITTEGKTNEI